MKYPDHRMSLETRLSSSVTCWLGHELESRGIDAVVYTRYIISILLQEAAADPHDSLTFDLGSLWFTTADVPSPYSRKSRHRKTERKKITSTEDQNKIAAVECLRSISDEDQGLESLVDELCDRLKQVHAHDDGSPVTSSDSPTLISGHSEVKGHADVKGQGSGDDDPAERYYAAFPALHSHEPSLSPTLKESTDIWNRNPITHSDDQDKGSPEKASSGKQCPGKESPGKQSPGRQSPGKQSPEICEKRIDLQRGSITRQDSNNGRLMPYQSRRYERSGKSPRMERKSPREEKGHRSEDWFGGRSVKDAKVTVSPQEKYGKRHDLKKGVKMKTAERIEKSLIGDLMLDIDRGEQKFGSYPLMKLNEEKPQRKFGLGQGEICGDPEKLFLERKQSVTEPFVEGSMPISKLPKMTKSDVWKHTPPWYEEQSSWYVEPVQTLGFPDSYHDPLYKRRSFSDSLDSPPIVDASEHDDSHDMFIFGKPQLDDCAVMDDDVFAFSDIPADLGYNQTQIGDSKASIKPPTLTCDQQTGYDQSPLLEDQMTFSLGNLQPTVEPPILYDHQMGFSRSLPPGDHEPSLKDQMAYAVSQIGDLQTTLESSTNGERFRYDQREQVRNAEHSLEDQMGYAPLQNLGPTFEPTVSVYDQLLQSAYYGEPSQLVNLECLKEALMGYRASSITDEPIKHQLSEEHPIEAQIGYGQHMLNVEPLAAQVMYGETQQLDNPSSVPPMQYLEDSLQCVPELNIEDYDMGKTFGINWMAEKMADDVLTQAGLSADGKVLNSELLTSNFESILESVKHLEAEYQFRKATDVTNVNQNHPVGGKTLVEALPLFYNVHSSFSGGNFHADGSESSPDGKLPPSFDGSVNSLPFWTPEGVSHLWSNEDQTTAQAYLDMLNFDLYNWGIDAKSIDANLYKSFDLIASEHTAFNDMIQPKIPHVHSEPNMKLSADGYGLLNPNDILPKKEYTTSGSEHLYFSPKTHFCPIYAAEETATHESKTRNLQPQDLFGGYTTTGTPYQEYRNTPQPHDKSFVPKFRVQKNSDKFVQTGESLDIETSTVKCSDDYENCLTDDKLDDKIEYVIAILDDEPGQEADAERSFPIIDVTIDRSTTPNRDMRSLWVSADDNRENNERDEATGNIWSSGYDDDTMFLFGIYDDVSSNDPGYFSEHVEACEATPVTPEEVREVEERDDKMQSSTENTAYNWSLFAPLPTDAVYSSDLEQIWLRPDSRSTPPSSRPSTLVRRKPCTYFMEGKCRRSVCKYSHDLSNITCRFWLEGDCFKGQHCPFLHDHAWSEEGNSGEDSGDGCKVSRSYTPPKREDANQDQSKRRQGPRKFYVFKRNSSQPAVSNKPAKSARKATTHKPHDTG